MNSDIPTIKVTNKPLTKTIVDDLNKVSMMLLQKQKNMNGGKRKKSKTRKINKHRN